MQPPKLNLKQLKKIPADEVRNMYLNLVNELRNPTNRISTFRASYQIGWIDGWNSCRYAKPEDRTFRRLDGIRQEV